MQQRLLSRLNRTATIGLIALAAANLAATFVLWVAGIPPKPTPYWTQALGEAAFLAAWIIVLVVEKELSDAAKD